MATKPDSIQKPSHERSPDALWKRVLYELGSRRLLRNIERFGFFHLVKRVYKHELLAEWMWM